MAKSKSGGSRSYLRGKLGADVYSIGKDGKGKKQQVVRALAESVANPQTQAQMRGRMIMATISQIAHAMNPIIDHSFDNVPNGQPSISEFVSRAYKTYLADSKLSNPAFGYNPYGSKDLSCAALQVSAGKARPFVQSYFTGLDENRVEYGRAAIRLVIPNLQLDESQEGREDPTYQQLLDSLFGGNPENYFTIVALGFINGKSRFVFARFNWNYSGDLTQKITNNTPLSSFCTIESNYDIDWSQSSKFESTYNVIKADPWFLIDLGVLKTDAMAGMAVICTKKTASGFTHSSAKIDCLGYAFDNNTLKYTKITKNVGSLLYTPYVATFTDALATYPIGVERFLNGGEL